MRFTLTRTAQTAKPIWETQTAKPIWEPIAHEDVPMKAHEDVHMIGGRTHEGSKRKQAQRRTSAG